MKNSNISRRNFLTYTASAALGLWFSRGVAAQTTKTLSGMQLDIAFEIAKPSAGFSKPPYVAVWLENTQGLPVKTVALWYEQSNKGPRWLNELRRWYSSNKLESTVSSPTRQPGKYNLTWDGKDSKNVALAQGDYYVCIETAREHGPYQLFREKLSLGSNTVTKSYSPDGELKTVSLDYAKHG
jgi:hypothetical protein